MGFARQEYWSGSPFPPPGNIPNPEMEPESPALQADSLLPTSPREVCEIYCPNLLSFHPFYFFFFFPSQGVIYFLKIMSWVVILSMNFT